MEIQEFADMREFERIMANWAEATGLACAAVGADGKRISKIYNQTDFCIKYTRGGREGCSQCEKCDRQGHGRGICKCQAGLAAFSVDLTVNGVKAGTVSGGQVLTSEPDEEASRRAARENGVNEDKYLEDLHRVRICPEAAVHASAELLGSALNHFIRAEYASRQNRNITASLGGGIRETNQLAAAIKKETGTLRSIQNRQKILALNASIEAARAGERGAGFAVVASEVGKLSERSSVVYKKIDEVVTRIDEVVSSMQLEDKIFGR